jgi:hypothetical protein
MAARRRSAPQAAPPRRPPSPAKLERLPKISASLIEFAQPLIEALPQPPTIEQMRQVMQIATIAWNLPVLEDEPGGERHELRALYERQMKLADPWFRAMMDRLLHERRARWGHDPRLVASVEVVQKPEEFQIVATASMLGKKST